MRILLFIAAFLSLGLGRAEAEERFITLASTTSTEQSGLFSSLLPAFRKDSGIEVRVVAVGTGQALRLGERGDADALLVHDRIGEDKFVAEGFGIDRRDVMYNDFVVVGPKADPAAIKGLTVAEAFRRIAAAQSPFTSRGDDSGTNRSELRVWKNIGIDVKTSSQPWYRELGAGMGPTLNTAAAMGAYALTDRGTWASFKNRQELVILVEGDKALFNPYGSILINPARHPGIKHTEAKTWHDWLTGPKGQSAIAAFKIDGEQLFFPQTR
ncbi:ABC-type tungstate transport system, permease component [Candidatus Terasakiella magnetica]|nr:ABC-type tungstate transport system, permease component [Candidatus Terasakiella magnetica]